MKTVVVQNSNGNPPKLYMIYNNSVKEVFLSGKQSFGRVDEDLPAPEICCNAQVVSRSCHGEFVTGEFGTTYRDNSSTNGTFINGVRIVANLPIKLHNGDILRIHPLRANKEMVGKDVVIIFLTEYSPVTCWKTADLAGNITEINIGREEKIGLNCPSVSRHHASFKKTEQGWKIFDNSSLNGIYLNGLRVNEYALLKPLDVVRIVNYVFVFLGDTIVYTSEADKSAPKAKPDLCIDIEKRTVKQHAKTLTLLRDVHFDVPGGTVNLLLGSSGAGKTTFFNAVTGYEKADALITYKGTDVYKNYKQMMNEIGFVPQEELMRFSDTVFNTLYDAARMRLSRNMPKEDRTARVIETLKTFNIYQERNSLVRTLSGGQQKRLNVALDYITKPSLLFLDEPDSGVDSSNTLELAKSLRDIADSGKIIFLISHSPDRLTDFLDNVIVLAKSSADNCGRLAFFGPVEDALRFFEISKLDEVVPCLDGKKGHNADYYIEKFARRSTSK